MHKEEDTDGGSSLFDHYVDGVRWRYGTEDIEPHWD